ncbi:hypothetical protein [Bacillus cereus]|uniref:hypothetical protein n=1 Tax=Bacillus cereus TaxID=1396 RepID=UPI0035CD2651
MVKKISASRLKKNKDSLSNTFKAFNDSITHKTNVSISDKQGFVTSFRNSEIVIGMAWDKSYIEIKCKSKDADEYEGLGLKRKYYIDEAVMEYEKHSDYQATVENLVVDPMDTDYRITIRLSFK